MFPFTQEVCRRNGLKHIERRDRQIIAWEAANARSQRLIQVMLKKIPEAYSRSITPEPEPVNLCREQPRRTIHSCEPKQGIASLCDTRGLLEFSERGRSTVKLIGEGQYPWLWQTQTISIVPAMTGLRQNTSLTTR